MYVLATMAIQNFCWTNLTNVNFDESNKIFVDGKKKNPRKFHVMSNQSSNAAQTQKTIGPSNILWKADSRKLGYMEKG